MKFSCLKRTATMRFVEAALPTSFRSGAPLFFTTNATKAIEFAVKTTVKIFLYVEKKPTGRKLLIRLIVALDYKIYLHCRYRVNRLPDFSGRTLWSRCRSTCLG